MSNSEEEEKQSARVGARVPASLRARLEEIARKARLDISDVVRIGLMTQMPNIEQVVLMTAAAPDLGLHTISELVSAGARAHSHRINLIELIEGEISRRELDRESNLAAPAA